MYILNYSAVNVLHGQSLQSRHIIRWINASPTSMVQVPCAEDQHGGPSPHKDQCVRGPQTERVNSAASRLNSRTLVARETSVVGWSRAGEDGVFRRWSCKLGEACWDPQACGALWSFLILITHLCFLMKRLSLLCLGHALDMSTDAVGCLCWVPLVTRSGNSMEDGWPAAVFR